jgi:rod shape-determining protein MreD
MRWLTFALLAALAICCQTTIAPRLGTPGVYPDIMLILVIHYALHAQTADGLLAGWLMGLLVDLTTVQRFGLVAVAYGVIALVIWSVRDLLFPKHPLSHFSLTFLSCFAVQLVLRGYFHLSHHSDVTPASVVVAALLTAAYTGLWAVPIHWFLLRYWRVLGLRHAKGGIYASPARMKGAGLV